MNVFTCRSASSTDKVPTAREPHHRSRVPAHDSWTHLLLQQCHTRRSRSHVQRLHWRAVLLLRLAHHLQAPASSVCGGTLNTQQALGHSSGHCQQGWAASHRRGGWPVRVHVSAVVAHISPVALSCSTALLSLMNVYTCWYKILIVQGCSGCKLLAPLSHTPLLILLACCNVQERVGSRGRLQAAFAAERLQRLLQLP
jgi:hypothetical protein